MAAPKTVLWSMDEHTRAKHVILHKYLNAWLPIMSSFNGRLLLIDGFAGPGEYEGGEKGSPQIMIDAFLDHSYLSIRQKEVVFLFIEENRKRYEHLQQLLQQKGELRAYPPTMKYHLHQKKFYDAMDDLLAPIEEQRRNLAPTFAFIDPFGYSHTPMEIIRRLMSHYGCEVLITFMYELMFR